MQTYVTSRLAPTCWQLQSTHSPTYLEHTGGYYKGDDKEPPYTEPCHVVQYFYISRPKKRFRHKLWDIERKIEEQNAEIAMRPALTMGNYPQHGAQMRLDERSRGKKQVRFVLPEQDYETSFHPDYLIRDLGRLSIRKDQKRCESCGQRLRR